MNKEKCKYCKDEGHTSGEHKQFKDLFKMKKPALVSQIIALEMENERLETLRCRCGE